MGAGRQYTRCLILRNPMRSFLEKTVHEPATASDRFTLLCGILGELWPMTEALMKLADLEHQLLPMVPTSTLARLAETIQDCRVTAELFERLTVLATWAKR